ncbi:MAG: DNA polymerase III subunit delta [Cryomorphaceae bacterium]|jgi:DNA polymerase-3 subunit delta|nr:DNA polymerase III subunit delta [Cryomorphaceae bacterium]|tara:strand:- start:7239 stop:8243 length:1005 start_codon:yes stop_codon:yes gene_type:complete
MTLEDLSNNLKQGKFLPVYIFEGDEPFFINRALELVIEESLEDDQKDFNLNILYGRDTDSISIVNHSKRYPVMSDKNVVIVREAQDLKDIDSLSSYIGNLNPNTILAIGLKGKKLDKRKSLYKSIRNNKDVLHISFKRLYENQIPYWIDSQVQNRGMIITQKASILLTENIGSDLLRINHELEKICAFLGNKNEIDEKAVEHVTGFSREFNNFELVKSLATKNLSKAYKISKSFSENPKKNPVIVSISILFSSFSKALVYSNISNKNSKNVLQELNISEYALRDIALLSQNYTRDKLIRIIGYLRDADRQAKGMGSTNLKDGTILNELLFKILY